MSAQTTQEMETALCRVLKTHGLVCGAIISAEGQILLRIGDYSTLEASGLASTLLGPYGSARATFDSLEGQLLPQIWAQGRVFAFADRWSTNLAVSVFGQSPLDAVEQCNLSQRVSQSISVEFGRTAKNSPTNSHQD